MDTRGRDGQILQLVAYPSRTRAGRGTLQWATGGATGKY
jgi:hypothetical protein